MPTQSPVTLAKAPGGVLPMSAVNDKSGHSPQNSKNRDNQHKSQNARLKVLIRRLPPALTQSELEKVLGDEWKPGNGKVDLLVFKPGKASKHLAKPSKPSRAYIQVASEPWLEPLAQKVRQTTFSDSKAAYSTAMIPALPPTLEFAPYGKVASAKRRHDARQSTIDQDPEFIDFLKSLTEPIQKPKPADAAAEANDSKPAKVTDTPLIQHLREKKAAKERGAQDKAAHKQARQTAKDDGPVDSKPEKQPRTPVKDVAESPEKKSTNNRKVDKLSPKDNSKSPKKDKPVATLKSQPPRQTTPTPQPAAKTSATIEKQGAPPSAGVARMLQRDLGIKGRGARNQRLDRQNAEVKNDQSSSPRESTLDRKSSTPTAPKAASTPTNSIPPAQSKASPTPQLQPNLPRQESPSQQKPTPTGPAASTPGSTKHAPPTPAVSPTATRAFLKHANPSQGITEALLEKHLSVFGEVSRVEIDKRKGFAYVDFATPAGLQAAVKASPVPVAQGSVQVLERKDRVHGQFSGVNAGVNSSVGGAGSVPKGPAAASPAATIPPSPAAIARGPPNMRGGPSPGFRGRGGGRGRGGFSRGGNGGGPAAAAAAASAGRAVQNHQSGTEAKQPGTSETGPSTNTSAGAT